MSGYGLANTSLSVWRGVEDDGYGDEQHRLDPDAAIATNLPASIEQTRPTKDTRDQTSQTPSSREHLIVRVSAAADGRVPGGGIRVGDLLKDQGRDELFAVTAITKPYVFGRQTPDRLIELDRLS